MIGTAHHSTPGTEGSLVNQPLLPRIDRLQYLTAGRRGWFTRLHRGYKLRLCVTIDDVLLAGNGTHISVWVFLMRGEYDDSLEWPFSADITIKLVNWRKSQDGREVVTSTIAHDRLLASESKHLSPGIFKFIAYNEVESTTGFRQYLKNECLMFRVTRVVVHSDSNM